MELFVTVILLTVTGAQGSQLEGPQNTLSAVGSNVTFKCLSLSRNCTGIEWLKYAAGNPMTIFNYRGTISAAFVDRFSVENKFGCFLIIKNVQLTDAGRYICRALISSNTVEKSALLFILDTHPKCTTNASMDDTVEEDGVHLNCVVKYNGTNKASMDWKGVEDSPAAVIIVETQPKGRPTIIAPQRETAEGEGTYNGTNRASIVWKGVTDTPVFVKIGETIILSYFVVASPPEVPSFTCITSFPVETNDKMDGREIDGLATNIPNTICETSATKVLYSVRNVSLSPSLSYYPSGSVITCTAKGRPLPTFKWQEMENNGVWMDIQNQNGSEFTKTNVSSKRHRCVAMNVVRGKSHNSSSDEFLVDNTGSDSRDSFTATATISVAVGVAVGFLLLIVLLIICFYDRVYSGYKCRHSGNKSQDNIREEQPLPENPDTCIYSVVNKKQNAHPKAKIGLASTSESPKLPQGATPQAMPRTDKSKAGHTNTYQHEEVTYADLAMEFGPRKVVPKYNPEPQDTLYAAVGAA